MDKKKLEKSKMDRKTKSNVKYRYLSKAINIKASSPEKKIYNNATKFLIPFVVRGTLIA